MTNSIVGIRAHTPGPWSISEWRYDTVVAETADGTDEVARSCFVNRHDGNRLNTAEERANACLISAAPDLLDVAKALPLHWLDSGVLTSPRTDELLIKMEIVGTTYEAEFTVGQLRAAAAAITKAVSP